MVKKKTAKPKIIAGVAVASKPKRKSSANRTSFSKEHPSSHAFQAGQSGNPLGRFPGVGEHLFSRNAPMVLGARAPDEVCIAYGLPKHSSVSQCILQRAATDAMRSSDPSVRADARDFLLRVTEGSRVNVNAQVDFSGGGMWPSPTIVFLKSDGDGRLYPDDLKMVEADRGPGAPPLALAAPED